jgi:hypothetical protein
MELLIPSVKRPGSGVKVNHTAQMRVQISHGNPPFDIGKVFSQIFGKRIYLTLR